MYLTIFLPDEMVIKKYSDRQMYKGYILVFQTDHLI